MSFPGTSVALGSPGSGGAVGFLRRVVDVRPGEVRALFLACAYFFFVLMAYYIIRPVRDEMGVAGGVENLAWLFTGTLALTLLVHPIFTWAVARYPRRRFIPLTYRFFAVQLLLFFLLFRILPEGGQVWVGRVFFNWTSVFNLFVVSVFWAFMADVFRLEQGKRLFGFIGVGGTVGAILGSAVTASLARALGPVNLLVLSALGLELALRFAGALGRWTVAAAPVGSTGDAAKGAPSDEEAIIGGRVWAALGEVARSPYLLGIVLYMLLFTFTSTALYFQQANIVAQTFGNSGERTAFFARIDLWVNVLTLVTQVFLTGRIIRWVGVGWALAILPLVTLVGFGWLSLAPTAGALMAVQVVRRGWNYGLMKPAMETLFTVLEREEKYKAKNLIDTFVYRAGDQIGAWSYTGLMGLGLGLGALALVNVPVAAVWVGVGLAMGVAQERKAGKIAPRVELAAAEGSP